MNYSRVIKYRKAGFRAKIESSSSWYDSRPVSATCSSSRFFNAPKGKIRPQGPIKESI